MGQQHAFALGRSDLDGFLSAGIGLEDSAMPPSVISAPAQQELAPWNKAGLEAGRPVADGGRVAFFYFGDMIEEGSAEQMFLPPKLPQTQKYVTGRLG